MEINNPLYKNQGIHANVVLLTSDESKIKVLLVKRTNNPFCGMWALPGGAVYNNETVEDAVKRELNEKTGIKNITPKMFGVFSDVNRAPQMRMVGIGYIAVIDKSAVSFVKQTAKTDDANWFVLDDVPSNLAYDHNKMLTSAISYLKTELYKSSELLKTMFPFGATMPEIQKFYETILNEKLDRRNFRKKLIQDGFVEDSGKMQRTKGVKSSIIYNIK